MLEGENKIQNLLARVGGQNRYQYLLFLACCMKWIIAAMILFSLNFFYYVPDFDCTKDLTADYQTCQDFVCSYNDEQFWKNHLKQPLKASIALDYGVIMVCSNQWIISVLQSVSYFGALVGYLIIGHIADNKGRKLGQMLAWSICIGGQVMMISSVNLVMIGIGSFMLGFGANGAMNIHYNFFKELVLGKTRSRMVIAIQLAFSFGISLISLLSYLIDEWKYIVAFFMLIPSVISLILFKFVEETPQFTLKKGIRDFTNSFNRIAKINNKPHLDLNQVQDFLVGYSTPSIQNQVTIFDLFRYKSLCYISIVIAIINFSVQFIYDGSILSLDKFGFNVYFNQILVGLVQITASIFGTLIVPRVMRKKYLTLSFGIICVITIGMGIQSLTYHHESDELNYHTIIQMILIIFLRFTINSAWGVCFVFVTELFPNEISALSIAWVSAIGTVGATISPYIRLVTANMTMFIMALLCVIVVFLVRTLPETKGKAMVQRIKQRHQQKEAKISVISNE